LNPQAEHLLDWFQVTMRLTVLTQTAKGLLETAGEGEDQEPLRSEVLKTLESIKWYLWHGNVFQAFRHLQFVEMDLESAAFERQDETTRKLLKAVEEFSTYIERNGGFIPNYGERYRNGERISTGFVESAINQVVSKRMAKKQQMQWTQRGAHLLLQVRTRVLNEEWEDVFRRWYPDFRQQQSMKAGVTPRNLPLSIKRCGALFQRAIYRSRMKSKHLPVWQEQCNSRPLDLRPVKGRPTGFQGRVGVPAREHKSSGLNRLRSPSCAPVLKGGDKGSRSRLKARIISLQLTETRTAWP
jgi:hypothetical protein